MRASLTFCSICVVAIVLSSLPLSAQTPTGAGLDQPPATVQGQRNWLLARLIVDRNLSGEQVAEAEQKLANMSPDQLDVLVRVYQHKRGEQAAASETELGLARENLSQLKNTRDALAQEVQSWRDYRQAQYVNFGAGPAFNYGGYNYGFGGYGVGYGLGGFGYSFGYPAAGGYPYAPFGAGLGVYPNFAPNYVGYPAGAYSFAYPAVGGFVTGGGFGVY
jgi:hypothetical protein